MEDAYRRRAVLSTISAAGLTAVAGCSGNDVEKVNSLEQPTLGSGPVEVELFEDFGCSGCKSFHQSFFKQLETEYIEQASEDAIQLVHYDFVLPAGGFSGPAANAARFVQHMNGNEQFWQFASWLFNNQDQYDFNTLVQKTAGYAQQPEPETRSAIQYEKYSPVIDSNITRGESMGVEATPTVFVGGNKVPLNYQDITAEIERQLE